MRLCASGAGYKGAWMAKRALRADQLNLLALCRTKGISLPILAREAQRHGLDRLMRGEIIESSIEATQSRRLLRATLDKLPHAQEEVEQEVQPALLAGARLTTVLDEDYPLNLRLIYNLPPFLFYLGKLDPDDTRAVAVVGTRNPTDEGRAETRRITTELVKEGVTILSGLAAGIDSEAHRAALEAGGRTVAVIGTGILRTYPKENSELSKEIGETGAVVSQFFPSSPPANWSFPLRNVVMSGLGQGTVVVEASATSGAKMQARLALEHGKKVFLPRSLVENYEWAQKYAERIRAVVVDRVEDIVGHLRSVDAIKEKDARREQLSLLG